MDETIDKDAIAERDAQLRRRLLNVARLNAESYQHGYVPWSLMLSARDDNARPVDNDDHAARLMDELVAANLLAEAKQVGLDKAQLRNAQRRFKLTDKGWSLWSQDIPPHALVADDRNLAR